MYTPEGLISFLVSTGLIVAVLIALYWIVQTIVNKRREARYILNGAEAYMSEARFYRGAGKPFEYAGDAELLALPHDEAIAILVERKKTTGFYGE